MTVLRPAWFEQCLDQLEITKERLEGPSKLDIASDYPKAQPFTVDLRRETFCTLLDLVNLYLLAQLVQGGGAHVQVLLPAIAPGETPGIGLKDYDGLRKERNIRALDPGLELLYQQARPAYGFLSFLANFGLLSSLEQGPRLSIPGWSRGNLRYLWEYRAVREGASRVLPFTAVRGLDDVESFRSLEQMAVWEENLAEECKRSPIFRDGEFARVYGYQLALNMVEHCGLPTFEAGSAGLSKGATTMRVLQAPLSPIEKRWFSPVFAEVLSTEGTSGFLEICAGDWGQGLFSSLAPALMSLRQKFGLDSEVSSDEAIAFAFHERGSRKPPKLRWGGAHALNRILRSVRTHRGGLRIISSGWEFIYTFSGKALGFEEDRTKLGYFPILRDKETKKLIGLRQALRHPHGLQLQIVLPLTPVVKRRGVKARAKACDAGQQGTSRSPSEEYQKHQRIVSAGVYLPQPIRERRVPRKIEEKLTGLTNILHDEPENVLIVYDFSSYGYSWSEEAVALFLESQKRVLHTRLCIGVNLDPGLGRLLQERESLDGPAPHPVEFGDGVSGPEARRQEHFFDVLSSEHRILIVQDTEEHHWFLGLGQHNLLEALHKLFGSEDGCRIADLSTEAEKQGALDLYMRANPELFRAQEREGGDLVWQCALGPNAFRAARQSILARELPALLRSHGCLKNGDSVYKLPVSPQYATTFLQSTPLLQDPEIRSQVGNWMRLGAEQILEKVGKESGRVLLVTVTGPGELLCRSIIERTGEKWNVLNLGTAWEMDPEGVVEGAEWPFPALLVMDVMDKGRTSKSVLQFLQAREFQVEGVLVLFRFNDSLSPGEVGETLIWEEEDGNEDGDKLPWFFFAELGMPKQAAPVGGAFANREMKYYLVEPFSLETFNYRTLSGEKYVHLPKEQQNFHRLLLLERIGALRAGHWIHGSHHFRVTTCFKKVLENDEVAGQVCWEILMRCQDSDVTDILLPLHSHIGEIKDRVEAGAATVLNRRIAVTHCLAARNISQKQFYLLPLSVKGRISKVASEIADGKRTEGINILIIDDAIASGNTSNSLIRAIVRECNNQIRQVKEAGRNCGYSPVAGIDVYTILDRQDRSRRTVSRRISRLTLAETGELKGNDEKPPSICISFDSWLDVELPVSEKDECKQCEERERLMWLKRGLALPDGNLLLGDLDQRIEELKPRSTETPDFESRESSRFRDSLVFGPRNVNSVPLALWTFYDLIHRGFPLTELVRIYGDIQRKSLEDTAPRELTTILIEMGRLFFRSWSRLSSLWSADEWLGTFEEEVRAGTEVARHVLPYAALALKGSGPKEGVIELFVQCLRVMAAARDEVRGDLRLVENLFVGLGGFLLYLRLDHAKFEEIEEKEGVGTAFVPSRIIRELKRVEEARIASPTAGRLIQELLEVARLTASSDPFLPSLISVLNHTVRAWRHPHPHLLPAQLETLAHAPLPAAPVERRSVVTRLKRFNYCLELVERKAKVLSVSGREAAESLRERSDELCRLLGEGRDTPTEAEWGTVRSMAGELLDGFPDQQINEVGSCLRRCQVEVTSILKDLWRESREKRPEIEWETPFENSTDQEQVWVLWPPSSDLRGVISNFTVGARVGESSNLVPGLAVAIDSSEGRLGARIKISIFTNLAEEVVVRRNILWGPGTRELSELDLKLFGVQFDFRTRQTGPDRELYSGALVLDLVRGIRGRR